MKMTVLAIGLMLTTLLAAIPQNRTAIFSYNFDQSTEGWTIKNNTSGFLHGYAASLAYVGNGGNTTKCFYAQNMDLAGGVYDIAASPVLNLATYSGQTLYYSFDYLYSNALGDSLKPMYKTASSNGWQKLAPALPTSNESAGMLLFTPKSIQLPANLLVSGIQFGILYDGSLLASGAAVDNVKIEAVSDTTAPKLIMTAGNQSVDGNPFFLTLTVEDASAMSDSLSGNYAIGNSMGSFFLHKVMFQGTTKYKAVLNSGSVAGSATVVLKDVLGNQKTVSVDLTNIASGAFSNNFEQEQNYATSLPGWKFVDMDKSNNFYLGNYQFPGQGQPASFVVFNNQATTPAFPDSSFAHSGRKSLLCMDAINAPNNDWIITPAVNIEYNVYSFYTRSIQSTYGLDRFRVLYSFTGNDPSDFIPSNLFSGTVPPITADGNYQAPVEWTEYTFGDMIPTKWFGYYYIAINCVSNNNFGLLIDDFITYHVGSIDDQLANKSANLHQNYPNPFNPITSISYELKATNSTKITVYNAKGELVKLLFAGIQSAGKHSINFDATGLNSGVYFYKLETVGQSMTKKMMFLK